MLVGTDYWTSGTDVGLDDSYFWCANMTAFEHPNVNWKNGQPVAADGDCVFVQFSNVSANASSYALGNCEEKKSFVCEVKLAY